MNNKNDTVYLFTYKNALGHEAHMAIYADDKKAALKQYQAYTEATDRLIGESVLTHQQYREWLKSL